MVLRSLGRIVNRASGGDRTTSDLQLWSCTLRRARRLRSRLSRGMAGGRPRKASLRDVHNGCGRCSPGLWLLADRLLLPCSLWLDISRYIWEAASNVITEGWLRDRVQRAIVAFFNPHTARQYERDRCVDLVGEHLSGHRGLQDRLLELSGRRLLCHFQAHERCHADELIRQFLLKYPEAYVVGWSDEAPPQEVKRLLWPWLGPGRRSMVARCRALPPRMSLSSRRAWGGVRV